MDNYDPLRDLETLTEAFVVENRWVVAHARLKTYIEGAEKILPKAWLLACDSDEPETASKHFEALQQAFYEAGWYDKVRGAP